MLLAMSDAPTVLLVDDDEALTSTLAEGLRRRGFVCMEASSGEKALEILRRDQVDVVVTDLRMPGMDGNEFCRNAREGHPEVPVVLLTAFGDYEAAVESVRVGAYDFLSKPVKLDVLTLTVRRAAEHRALREEVRVLRSRIDVQDGILLGESRAIKSALELIARIDDSDSSVLVCGESGTGKELVARALHRRRDEKGGAFVAINCAAMPAPLLESELFGHEKGAFTDARTAHEGLFVKANGGTLFLDEIAEMPLEIQAKLLRALQERVVRPVGGTREVPFSARIISATHRDLELAIEERRFREDLYYRINVIQVDLPPLRARGNDVLLLAQKFLVDFSSRAKKDIDGFTSEAAARLLSYSWPGNVRELQNAIERAVALADRSLITPRELPQKVQEAKSEGTVRDATEWVSLESLEKKYILDVLKAMGGNRTLAAKTLGLDRTTLWRKLERYEKSKAET